MSNDVSMQAITGDVALFGRGTTQGIVAVEPDDREGLRVYRREGDKLLRERAPFRPWILLPDKPSISLPGAMWTDLDGDGLRVLAEFPNAALWQEARFRIREQHVENLTYPGLARQALIRSGETLFKGLMFGDVVRLQFDIETDGLDPTPEGNRILLIAVSDSTGFVDLLEGDERELLERFAAVIRERDPDAIEGHNILGFDFPFVLSRAQRHGVRLTIGRDGSEPRQGRERNYAIAAGGNSRPFTPIHVHGRHVIDTYLVVQRFDWAKGALTSYGLKECARVFGLAEEDRIELPRDRMAELYRDDTDRVRTYARQDVIETRRLADLICPVEFYQTQMIPNNYADVVVTGNGEKINSLFVRAYLAADKAVPLPRASSPFPGGYTDVRRFGVQDRVVKADVESLYPSLMLTHGIAPASDTLGVFLPALRNLTARRLEAKRRAAESGPGHAYWEGLQGSFKVLINSFYGYLGGPFNWNDYGAAQRVTEEGRALVQQIADDMAATGSAVIEIDTDGVYFIPPPDVSGEPEERAYIEKIGSALPEGIRLAFDGRFQKMLSVKTKNYVLVTYENKRIYKGASLRSRADEGYGRRFLAAAIDSLLEHDLDAVARLYEQTLDDLLERRIPPEDLARRERVTEKTFLSGQKRRAAAVAAGVPVGDHVLVYEKTDGSLGLLSDYAQDENVPHYLEKLYRFAKRLDQAFEGSFDRYIPRPNADGIPHRAQTTLDL